MVTEPGRVVRRVTVAQVLTFRAILGLLNSGLSLVAAVGAETQTLLRRLTPERAASAEVGTAQTDLCHNLVPPNSAAVAVELGKTTPAGTVDQAWSS